MKKVVIGMSGGVDSSVAALLLVKQGFEVIGVTMNMLECQNDDSSILAKKIAAKLGISYYNMDVKEEFKKEVIDVFAKEYIAGRTPNPCILCNKKIKFQRFVEQAKTLFDADLVATGHYAKVDKDEETGRYFIRESESINKDQTYALYNLSQEQLSHVIFPLGSYTKDEVRMIAKENGLDNANSKESQEICFIKDKDYAGFIEKEYNYKSKEGDFVDINENIIGTHKGIIHYTVGQRRRVGLALKIPMYVYKINKEKNTVMLACEEESKEKQLICENLNFMPFETLTKPLKVQVKTGYLAKKVNSTIYPFKDGSVKVVFDIPQKAITPGQAVVFYDGDMVIGGGTIK